MAGSVRVDDVVVLKPAIKFTEDVSINIDYGPPFVSRGGEKLEAAINAFGLEKIDGLVCVDVGSSTGGFTDCLLQHGALRVYAIDVGYGILHWKLRNDERVVSMERTNARFVHGFNEEIQLVTVDASFISLRILLPVIKSWFGPKGGSVIALIKPQFEAGREDVARGEGVVRDREIHKRVLFEILEYALEDKFEIRGLIQSPLIGPKGNIEFLVYLAFPCGTKVDPRKLVNNLFNPNTPSISIIQGR
jgi:23S rRNA (cytidine1920-2'-O)/16S rRNA (cytidine1409-2'-O)-methyltransferase